MPWVVHFINSLLVGNHKGHFSGSENYNGHVGNKTQVEPCSHSWGKAQWSEGIWNLSWISATVFQWEMGNKPDRLLGYTLIIKLQKTDGRNDKGFKKGLCIAH